MLHRSTKFYYRFYARLLSALLCSCALHSRDSALLPRLGLERKWLVVIEAAFAAHVLQKDRVVAIGARAQVRH